MNYIYLVDFHQSKAVDILKPDVEDMDSLPVVADIQDSVEDTGMDLHSQIRENINVNVTI